jgi:two-component system sensor histidine kinase KdpD
MTEPRDFGHQIWRQYAVALIASAAASLAGLWLERWTGYQAISLLYLLTVVLLALVVGRGPIVFGTILTAMGWSYLFAPPRWSFQISGFYDKEMVAMYFLVALTVAQLTAVLRAQRIEERQHAQSEIKARLLKESERLGRALLNSVSHELRTPLSTISGAAHTLRSSGPLTTVQEKMVAEVDSAAARLNRVVESLLSAARLQSGLLRPKLDYCDVLDVVKVALRNQAQPLAKHSVRNCVAPGLPLVQADFVLLEQAISNLLLNVAVHTPPGTTVTLSAQVDQDQLTLDIIDDGPGIPDGELDRVFDLFYRTTHARPGGTGLGLHIVRGFIEAQGGRVRAANRSERGAKFSISLPVHCSSPVLQQVA